MVPVDAAGRSRDRRWAGFAGARWPKHVGPEGIESPNEIGPLLVWQQPHVIAFAELIRSASDDPDDVRERYRDLVDDTAEFLASFALAGEDGRHHLPPPLMPAQEVYGARETWDPLLEVAYVRWALRVAARWREADGREVPADWLRVADGLRPPVSDDGCYAAVQNPPRTVFTDHPSMLGALGVVPDTGALDHAAMLATLTAGLGALGVALGVGLGLPDDRDVRDEARSRGHRPRRAAAAPRTRTSSWPTVTTCRSRTGCRCTCLGTVGSLMAAGLLFGGWVGEDGTTHRPELPAGWVVTAEGFPARP